MKLVGCIYTHMCDSNKKEVMILRGNGTKEELEK